MEEDSIVAFEWIKNNKEELYRLFASEQSFFAEEKPITLFMAGSPGAGKTEVSTRLIEQFNTKPVRIDADEIRKICPGYNGSNSSVFQKAANKGVNILYDHCLKKGFSLILDGTFAYADAIENVKRSLDKERRVEIYFVYQNPEQAWEITKVRELEQGRRVPKDVFIKAYIESQQNVQKIKEQYRDQVILNFVINDPKKESFDLELNITKLDLYIPEMYSEDDLNTSIK